MCLNQETHSVLLNRFTFIDQLLQLLKISHTLKAWTYKWGRTGTQHCDCNTAVQTDEQLVRECPTRKFHGKWDEGQSIGDQLDRKPGYRTGINKRLIYFTSFF